MFCFIIKYKTHRIQNNKLTTYILLSRYICKRGKRALNNK